MPRNFVGWGAVVLCLGVGPWSGAATLVLPCVADTSLFSQSPENNLGASDTLAVGGTAHQQPARGLVRFAAGSRPELAGATILSAKLEFVVTKGPGGGAASVFEAHRMLASWTEGRGTGTTGLPANPGESTWEDRQHPGSGWGAAGGKAGEDFATGVSGAVSVSGLGRYILNGALLAGDVRGWIADPASEQGWILISDAELTAATARRLGSRESGANAPTLTLEYQPAPAAPKIDRVGRKDGNIEFEFRAEAGNIYEVQYRNMGGNPGTWQVAATHVVKLISTNIVVRQSLEGAPARLYRVADVADVD